MWSWYWKPAGNHRHVSHDGAWMLTRDGAWRLTARASGEVFTYDDLGELMIDVINCGAVYLAAL